jgi:hypothetical protein
MILDTPIPQLPARLGHLPTPTLPIRFLLVAPLVRADRRYVYVTPSTIERATAAATATANPQLWPAQVVQRPLRARCLCGSAHGDQELKLEQANLTTYVMAT